MAYSKKEFINFEDLDLDYLLGDYTASEFDLSDDEYNNTDKIANENQEKAGSQKTYKCDQCDKSYNSISGIRGHLRNKHGVQRVKASTYRLKCVDDSKKTKKISMEQDKFNSLFKELFPVSLSNVCNNKFRNLKTSVHGKGIVIIGSALQENPKVKQLVMNKIEPLYYQVMQTSSEIDHNVNETLLSEYYQLFHNEILITEITDILKTLDLDMTTPIRQFVSTLNRQLMKDLINNRADVYQQTVENNSDIILSDTDQSVIYYISGFILKKLQGNQKRSLLGETVQSLLKKDNDSEKTFVNKFSEWTELIDRGGLKKPSDNFFLFIKSCEMSVRKHIDEKQFQTNVYATMKETIMEDHMVKHYSELLLSGTQSAFIMEYCVALFVKVRGHAGARLLKQTLLKSSESTKSMRYTLKEKSNIMNHNSV